MKRLIDTLQQSTDIIKHIVLMWKGIIETGDKALIAKMHNINDFYQNERETIIYGKTLKEIRNDFTKNLKGHSNRERYKG